MQGNLHFSTISKALFVFSLISLYLDMNKIIIVLISVIFILGIALYLRGCNTPNPVTTNYHQAETIYNVKIDSIRTLRKADFEKMKQDSVKAKITEIGYIAEITRLKKKIAEKKEIAMPEIKADSNVRELVVYYDSTISCLEQRIDTLQNEKKTQWVSFNKILAEYDEEIKQNKMFIGQQSETIEVLSKNNKKLKRRSKILTILIPVALVGGVLMAK